ncbi:hypothetical protein ACFSQ7_22480 [Paenibacillus rhizoplanae]
MALVYPAAMTSEAHQDAWIAALISIPPGIALVFLFVVVANISPDQNIIETQPAGAGEMDRQRGRRVLSVLLHHRGLYVYQGN